MTETVGAAEAKLTALAALRAGTSVLLVGPAGIGKTTALAGTVEGLGDRREVLVGVTSQTAQQLPFAAFAHLLPAGDAAPVERLGAVIRGLAPRRPVLAIDDAHHLDGESAVLVQHLVVGDAAVALLACREVADLPDPLERLRRDGLVQVVEVGPLDLAGCAAVAERALGGVVDATTADRLLRASGGNPLHLEELVGAARRLGLATVEGGVWRIATLPVLGGSAELIAARVGAWPPAVRAVARTVAAVTAAPTTVLVTLHGADAVGDALRLGVVRARPIDGALELEHPLVHGVLRAELGAEAATEELRAVVQAAAEEPDAAGLLPGWLVTLGPTSPLDLPRLVAAADRMIDDARPHEARQLAEVALRLGEPSARPVRLRAAAQLGETVDAGDPEAAVQAARGAVEALTFGFGSLSDARRALAAAALSVGPGSSDATAELDALGQIAELLCGAPIGPGTDRLLALADAHGATLTGRIAAAGVGTALVQTGRHLEAIERYRAIDQEGRVELPYHRLQFALSRFDAALAAGLVDEAERTLVDDLRRGDSADSPTAQVYLAAAEAQWALAAGRPDAAAAHLAAVLGVLGGFDSAGIGAWAEGMLRWSRAWAGHDDPPPEPLRPSEQGQLVFPSAQLAAITAIAERGALQAARDAAIDLATRSEAAGHLWASIGAWHLAGRIATTAPMVTAAERVASDVQGHVASIQAAHLAALAARSDRELESVARDFGRVGLPSLTHEALVQAAGVAADDGRRARADELLTAALDSLGDARPTFAARASAGATRDLTVREHEVVSLAATDRTNAEIAAELGISRRTAETHLQAAYRKLGVSDRSALRAIVAADRSDRGRA